MTLLFDPSTTSKSGSSASSSSPEHARPCQRGRVSPHATALAHTVRMPSDVLPPRIVASPPGRCSTWKTAMRCSKATASRPSRAPAHQGGRDPRARHRVSAGAQAPRAQRWRAADAPRVEVILCRATPPTRAAHLQFDPAPRPGDRARHVHFGRADLPISGPSARSCSCRPHPDSVRAALENGWPRPRILPATGAGAPARPAAHRLRR